MSALKTELTAELSYSTSATVRWQISLHDLTRQHSISGLIRATLVSGFGLKSYSYSFRLGLLCVLFWQVWRTKEKHLCYRVLSTTRNHVNMEWYRWMLHESKTKQNDFPYLGKHVSEAFNLIFTLSNHFTHFWPFQYFSRYSVSRYFVTLFSNTLWVFRQFSHRLWRGKEKQNLLFSYKLYTSIWVLFVDILYSLAVQSLNFK